ncbi:MAG: peptidoglycan-binding protein [Pseudonocardia sp.]|nr:peptidoglycan-binding protein [Pseudonocardia sp.]
MSRSVTRLGVRLGFAALVTLALAFALPEAAQAGLQRNEMHTWTRVCSSQPCAIYSDLDATWQNVLYADRDQYSIGVCDIDGIFGANTTQITKQWQALEGLAPDGVVAVDTWGRVESYSSRYTENWVYYNGIVNPFWFYYAPGGAWYFQPFTETGHVYPTDDYVFNIPTC